ncbi:MAG: hypothetical protein QOJ64_2920 [Acidobacteriota bacterium]|nr:hypothetical protein [Acidobacteriota bacterium]
MILLLALLIGVLAGLRSLTAPAVIAWAVYMGWLKLTGPLSLIGSSPSVVILTLLAIFELVADKLRKTPNRTAPLGLIARLVTGGMSGACITAAVGQGVFAGALLGAVGAAIGCHGGYHLRKRLVSALGTKDIYVAVVEDLVAIAGCLWVVSR